MKDAIEGFADHVIGTRFEDLPPEAVLAAKTFILDSIGVGLAGTRGPFVGELIGTFAETASQRHTARVWGYGNRLSPEGAALINGYQIHNSEYDCVHERAVIHPMTVLLACAMAEADRSGGVSGKDLILASVLGVDVACSLGVAAKSGLRFFRPATGGVFAATTALGVVRGFDRATLLRAYGHAYGQLGGTMQPHTEGSPMLGLQIGYNARNVMLAADIAAAGMPSIEGILEGRFGYFGLIEAEGDPRATLADLGRVWRLAEVAHKPFPSGRATHGMIDLFLELQREHGFKAEDIASATARVPSLTHHLVGRPVHDAMEANYARLNGQYTSARALIDGTVGIHDFDEARRTDPAVIALARRITVEVDDNPDPNALTPIAISIDLADGRRIEGRAEVVYGNPVKPMTRDAHLDKFRRNWRYSVGGLPESGADRMIELVDDLESVDDVRALIDVMVP